MPIPVIAGAAALTTLLDVDFSVMTKGAATSLPYGLTLERASTAEVRTNANTVVRGIATNTARIGSNGSCSGLVIEESRTNYFPYNSDWSALGNDVVKSQADLAPDGSSTAARLGIPLNTFHNMMTMINTNAGYWTSSTFVKRQPAFDVYGEGQGTFHSVLYQGLPGTIAELGHYAIAYSSLTNWTYLDFTVNIPVPNVWAYVYYMDSGANGGATGLWGHTLERGRFATEPIWSSGANTTRAAERLYTTTARVMSNGDISACFSFYPKGSHDHYDNAQSVLFVDEENYISISGGTVTLCVAGASTTSTSAMNWSAKDLVELFVSFGASAPSIQYRVNGGSTIDLGPTGSPTGTIPSSGNIDIFCAGTSSEMSCWLKKLTFYRSGGGPSWLV